MHDYDGSSHSQKPKYQPRSTALGSSAHQGEEPALERIHRDGPFALDPTASSTGRGDSFRGLERAKQHQIDCQHPVDQQGSTGRQHCCRMQGCLLQEAEGLAPGRHSGTKAEEGPDRRQERKGQ